MKRTLGISAVAAMAVLGSVVAIPQAAAGPSTVTVKGSVQTVASAGKPDGWKGWTVDVSITGSGVVATATAKANGRFTVDVPDTIPADGIIYFIAHAPTDKLHPKAPPATLATVATAIPSGDKVTLNERTTVAAAWAMAQFVSNTGIDGSAPGLRNSAGMAANLANPKNGNLAKVLVKHPNGDQTSTLDEFRTLTAAVASCVVDPFGTSILPKGACQRIMNIGAKAQDPVDPADSFRALAEIARNPSVAKPVLLYNLSTKTAVAGDTLKRAPVAWTVALRFNGDGKSLDGPGNFAVDAQGNIWVNNNYQYNKAPDVPVCGSDEMFKFSPTGQFTKYTGGGLSGAGLGILLNHSQDKVWISNFGFASPAPGCATADQPPHNTVTIFEPGSDAFMTGSPFNTGPTSWPQGMAEDSQYNVWTANCQNNTVTRWAGGDPTQGSVVTSADGLQTTMAFDMAANKNGVFVTGMLNDSVQMISFDGKHVSGPGPDSSVFNNPMGVASAPDGTIWVANSANVQLPCDNSAAGLPNDPTLSDMTGGVSNATFNARGVSNGTTNPYVGSVAMISPDGTSATQFTGGGVTMAWGINTDADGNVWVANFAGKRLSEFCGVNATTCPVGSQTTGAPISPAKTGFFFDGLVRNTGVVVDQSGNVWVANNWIQKANIKYNPGGHEIVAFLGIAAPTAHPAQADHGGGTSTPTASSSAAASSSASSAALANTGTDTSALLAALLALVSAGGVLVLIGRRRHSRGH